MKHRQKLSEREQVLGFGLTSGAVACQILSSASLLPLSNTLTDGNASTTIDLSSSADGPVGY